MTRAQLVSKLSMRMDVTKKEAGLYLSVILDSMMEKLNEGDRVVLQGFGSFKVNKYKARLAKKPLSGEMIQLPVRYKLSFHPGKELRERVNKEIFQVEEAAALVSSIRVSENVISISAR
jgi:integration host factor subunit beta